MQTQTKVINLWPISRGIAGSVSLAIGITTLYLTIKTAIGRDLTLTELRHFPYQYFFGMLSSWPRFFVGFWFVMTISSKVGMILNRRFPLSLISIIWFIWFVTIGKSLFPGTSSTDFNLVNEVSNEVVRIFGLCINVFLFTDILDGFYSIYSRFERWASEDSGRSDD